MIGLSLAAIEARETRPVVVTHSATLSGRAPRHSRHGLAAFTALAAVAAVPLLAQAPQPQAPINSSATFKSGVEAVTVTASVRDRRGKTVFNLDRNDFEVIDSGMRRQIRDFYTGDSGISLAVLVDISGSMAVGNNIDRAKEAVSTAMGGLKRGADEAGLFSFDSRFLRMVDFTEDLDRVKYAKLVGAPWGTTSLYDSIAEAAQALSTRSNLHRAVLVVTDGLDTGSRLTPGQVSGIASTIDVPVYVLVVATPVDRANSDVVGQDANKVAVTLADLARWTGGDTRVTSTNEEAVAAIADLFTEIRHRYLITFDPSENAGWHALEIRTPKRNLVVRARGWYRSGPP
jgi:VWFA-related protein